MDWRWCTACSTAPPRPASPGVNAKNKSTTSPHYPNAESGDIVHQGFSQRTFDFLDYTQSLSFLVHSNWETGASEMRDRARDWSFLPILRATDSRSLQSQLLWTRKERDCVQSSDFLYESTHSRWRNSHKNVHFEPSRARNSKFPGGACPRTPLAYECLRLFLDPSIRTRSAVPSGGCDKPRVL